MNQIRSNEGDEGKEKKKNIFKSLTFEKMMKTLASIDGSHQKNLKFLFFFVFLSSKETPFRIIIWNGNKYWVSVFAATNKYIMYFYKSY